MLYSMPPALACDLDLTICSRVILPTFNERQNLPIVTWLLNRTFTEKFVP
jgi:hypothetical protein